MDATRHVIVRRAQFGEVDAAVSVWLAANPSRDLPDHVERLRAWAGESGAVLLVADDGEHLVGMALRLPGRDHDGAGALVRGLCHLTGLCVLPERRGQHLGGRLLDAVLSEALHDGYVRATLWTHLDNTRAQALFAARGFRRTGRVAHDDLGAPMVHLACVLV